MNERYKELEKQCTEQQIDYDVGKMYDQVDHEKLSELIIRECIDVVEGGRFLHNEAPTAIFARECSGAIKRHFGVSHFGVEE